MGGKKRSYSKSKKKGKVVEEIAPEELDRFAGSSDEEDEERAGDQDASGGDDSSDEEVVPDQKGGRQTDQSKPKKKVVLKQKVRSQDEDGEDGASGDDSGEDSSDDDEDFDQYDKQQRQKHGAAGMADAMAKILGPAFVQSKKPASGTAVLSKTTTPLQRLHQQEKERAKELREKRRLKAINPLPALHVPLSVATSLTVGGTTKSVGQELELERLHRRVATRGVVALFNAVEQHQKKGSNEDSTPAKSSKTAEVKKMTKHGFLDMIKTAAASNKSKSKKVEAAPKEKENTSKWAAMQDDYMMNPKKNWDESSDESNSENSDGEEGPNAREGKEAPAKKRRVVSAR